MQSPSDVQKSQYSHDSGMGTLSPIMSSAPPVLFGIRAGGKMGCMTGGYPCQVLLSRLYRCPSHRVAVVHDIEPAPFRIGDEPLSLGIYRHLLSCPGADPDDLCSAAPASAHYSPPLLSRKRQFLVDAVRNVHESVISSCTTCRCCSRCRRRTGICSSGSR